MNGSAQPLIDELARLRGERRAIRDSIRQILTLARGMGWTPADPYETEDPAASLFLGFLMGLDHKLREDL